MENKKNRSGGTQKAPEEEERHFLHKLSDCCAQHAESHTPKPVRPLTEHDEMPEKCQKDMSSLCKILPRVEDAVDKNPHPSYIPHLCDFYQSVIQGRFCPHAPLLLEWGKGGFAGMYSCIKDDVSTEEGLLNLTSYCSFIKSCREYFHCTNILPPRRL